MRHTISISIVLAVIWLLNSGLYTPLMLLFGVVSIVTVVWISHRMDVVDHESTPVHLTLRVSSYYWWLTKKLIQSNIEVVACIWRGNHTISPCMEVLPVSQKTDMGRVIYANSITLTPGTVVVDLQRDHVLVHSLTKSGIEELKQGEMDSRVAQLEK